MLWFGKIIGCDLGLLCFRASSDHTPLAKPTTLLSVQPPKAPGAVVPAGLWEPWGSTEGGQNKGIGAMQDDKERGEAVNAMGGRGGGWAMGRGAHTAGAGRSCASFPNKSSSVCRRSRVWLVSRKRPIHLLFPLRIGVRRKPGSGPAAAGSAVAACIAGKGWGHLVLLHQSSLPMGGGMGWEELGMGPSGSWTQHGAVLSVLSPHLTGYEQGTSTHLAAAGSTG